MSIDARPAGRIVFRLYDSVCPLTARNFRELALGLRNGLSYAGTGIHRIQPEVRRSLALSPSVRGGR